jgi:hypothetical protein
MIFNDENLFSDIKHRRENMKKRMSAVKWAWSGIMAGRILLHCLMPLALMYMPDHVCKKTLKNLKALNI